MSGTDIRTCGYPFESAHILVYPVHFADKRLDRPDIESDLRKVKEYYHKQSYGRFNVSWEIKPETYISERTADIGWTKQGELNKEIVSNSGVSYPQPGGKKLMLFIRPFLGPGLGWNSTGGGKVMRIFDDHKGPGVIAHEMGHAMGLRHANSIETGKRSNQNAIEIDSSTSFK